MKANLSRCVQAQLVLKLLTDSDGKYAEVSRYVIRHVHAVLIRQKLGFSVAFSYNSTVITDIFIQSDMGAQRLF